VDVLRIDGGGLTGKKVKAPVRNEWFGSPFADAASFQAHPTFGFVCPVLQPDVDTPRSALTNSATLGSVLLDDMGGHG
jgi:hypothetical protein